VARLPARRFLERCEGCRPDSSERREQRDAASDERVQPDANEYAPQRALGTGADSLLAQLYGVNLGLCRSFAESDRRGVFEYIQSAHERSVVQPDGRLEWLPSTVNPNYSSFYNAPGYQFSLQQGENAINRGAAASGNAFSTSTLAGLDQFAQGTASNQYNNYTQQLLSLAGLGGSATAGTSASGTAARKALRTPS